MKRPTNGSANEPIRVPTMYSAETVLRDSSSSVRIGSRNTDTPTVWPGTVAIVVTIAVPSTTQA